MRKIMLLLVAFIFILTTTAHAEETNDQSQTIIKEYEFTTTSINFNYDAPLEIIEDGIIYTRKNIDYEIIKNETIYSIETKIFINEIIIESLTEQDDTLFECAMEINEDGYIGEISLKEIIYTERKVTGRTASHKVEYDYGLQVSKPESLSTIDVLYYDEETNVNVLVTLPFNKLKETTKPYWENNIHVQQTYRSIYEDEYLLIDGTRLSFSSDKPQFEGMENEILNNMRLSPEKNMITDSSWIGDASIEDDITSRLASFIVNRYVTGYKAIYSGSFDIPNMLVYDATAIYESELSKQEPNGTEYTVKAIVTYEEVNEVIPKGNIPVIAGTSTGVLGLCGLVFFIIKRRKKKNNKKTSSNLIS